MHLMHGSGQGPARVFPQRTCEGLLKSLDGWPFRQSCATGSGDLPSLMSWTLKILLGLFYAYSKVA